MEFDHGSKPYIVEDKTKKILDIILESDPHFLENNTPTESDIRKSSLLRMMKEDTDKIEYPLMVNLILILLIVAATLHYFYYRNTIALLVLILGLVAFFVIRYRLRSAILRMNSFQDNFERYASEGYLIKEMRHLSVKYLYLIFFPFVLFFSGEIINGRDFSYSFWMDMIPAVILSSIGWLIVFNDDRKSLNQMKTELEKSFGNPTN
ncbi:MAG: hypothetical protein IPM42_16235 [Saprospiraceae bacterium]|nr:hypothetical protein [Saprospiraceae bacterium]